MTLYPVSKAIKSRAPRWENVILNPMCTQKYFFVWFDIAHLYIKDTF